MLNAEQQAIFNILKNFCLGHKEFNDKYQLLIGKPGTGKTYLIGELINSLPASLKIAIAAPTNKAIKVLKEKVESHGKIKDITVEDLWNAPTPRLAAKSIHSLLGLKLNEKDDGKHQTDQVGKISIANYDVVFIDEGSMLDAELIKTMELSLAGALTRVVIIGDYAQLPPVQGEQDKSPIFAIISKENTHELNQIVRQTDENIIINLSRYIRQCIDYNERLKFYMLESMIDFNLKTRDDNTAFVYYGTQEEIANLYIQQLSYEPNSIVKIVCFTNKTVELYNNIIYYTLYGNTGNQLFSIGERIIVNTQCKAQQIIGDNYGEPVLKSTSLITSDELLVLASEVMYHPVFTEYLCNKLTIQSLEIPENKYIVYVANDKLLVQREVSSIFNKRKMEVVKLKKIKDETSQEYTEQQTLVKQLAINGWGLRNAFADIRHSYAITSHKSQGSTYDCVIVDYTDLDKIQDDNIFNKAIHVAITRSSKYLILCVT